MDHAASLPLPALSLPAEEESCPDEAPAVAPSDEDLLERVAGGDTEAFTILYGRFERPVFGVLLRLAGRRALAEEWLQETFTRVWRAAATHDRSRGAGRSWIFAIALNTARRQMGRLSSRAAHVPIDDPALGLHDGTAAGEEQITERLDSVRRREAVAGALAELPEFLREVVVLRCSRELSFAEIAEVTGAPQGTLKSRFHRAVAALRERLHDEGEPRGTRRRERGRRS
jgi:RNA polymerase sigma-70 factor (ECF subfamily)